MSERPTPENPSPRRPNILWFCADQMRYDTISALGNSEISTPNLDRLIAHGTAFENCYVQNQVCTPSRASFMTGRYPAAHQVYRNGNAFFPPSEKLVTKILADNGYRCGLIGKLHLSTASRLEVRPDDGYDLFDWCQNPRWERVEGSNAYWNWLKEKGADPAEMFATTPGYLCGGPEVELHQMAWLAERTIQFIDETDDQPWMLSLNPFDPHPPFDPPASALAKFGKGEHLTPPLFAPSDIEHHKRFYNVRNQMRVAVNPVLSAVEKTALTVPAGDKRGCKPPSQFDGLAVKAAYYAMIENLDLQFGRILDHLETQGELDNTLIIFSSDHGEMLGDHGLLYKGCRFFEGLVHIPLIIAGPGGRSGQRTKAMVETVDIAPTLLDYADIKIPETIQGRSLRALVDTSDQTSHHKECVVTDFNDSLGSSEVKHYTQASMTCDGRYKLAVYHSHPGLGELFDLQEDPHEFHCLWEDPGSQSLKSDLMARHMDRMMGTVYSGPPRVAPA